jgi:hypothetical protein
MASRIVAGLIVVALAVAAGLLATGAWRIPDRWNPFAPLSVDDAPNVLTRFKLARLAGDAQACRAALATSDFRVVALPDREPRDGCGWRNALRVEATSAAVGEPFTLTCEAAVALALFERHAMQPAAIAHFAQPVAQLRHYGSYACRNVGGRAGARRSEHAGANALDIAGFVLRDGREITVRKHWQDGGDDAAFLRDVHAGACRFFDVVLGPDYDGAHADHFHVDRGAYRTCR